MVGIAKSGSKSGSDVSIYGIGRGDIDLLSAPRSSITFGQLRAFVAVAEAGGFSLAAERLGLSQSTVSEAVRDLEAALGAGPLLVRRPSRSVGAPTAAGRVLLPEAQAAVEAVARLQQRAAARSGLDGTALRLAAVGSASARLLPGPLRAFRDAYPAVTLSLFEGTDAEVREWVRAGVADLGVAAATDRHGDAFPPGLQGEPISRDEMRAVFMASNHALVRLTAVSAATLAAHPFLMSAAGCEAAIETIFSAGKAVPRVVATVRDMPTLLAMASEGLGITIVPQLVLGDSGRLPGLRSRPLDPPVWRQLYLLRRPGRQQRAVAAFAALFRSAARTER